MLSCSLRTITAALPHLSELTLSEDIRIGEKEEWMMEDWVGLGVWSNGAWQCGTVGPGGEAQLGPGQCAHCVSLVLSSPSLSITWNCLQVLRPSWL